jgi:xanthine dehydrogenase small subunit
VRDTVRFLLGQEPRELRDIEPTLTVLDYLRRIEHRMGTKEGCAEGDCGACTVVLARPAGDRLRYRSVASCIAFAPTLDGSQLLSIEDVTPPGHGLHPLQRAMVERHASQCGFCTPGFVMTLWSLWASRVTPDRLLVEDALAGNLCRCTGYGPIVDAALETCSAGRASDHIERRAPDTLAQLHDWADREDIVLAHAGRRFLAPASLDALAELLLANPGATILGGGTDVGLWVTKQQRELETIVWLGRIAELQRIEDEGDELEIGAAVTYADAAKAITGLYPDAGELIRRLGGWQVRNAGTLGGNIANGSPIGDMAPILIAAGARLVLRRGSDRRELAVEDFFLAYGRQDLRPAELLERIILPKPRPRLTFRCYKISKRFDQDISALCAAFAVEVAEGRVANARIAFGGMAGTPQRAGAAEAALMGKPWSEATAELAAAALVRDFTPIDDMRASAAYRLKVAQNLMRKCFLESSGAEIRVITPRPARHV